MREGYTRTVQGLKRFKRLGFGPHVVGDARSQEAQLTLPPHLDTVLRGIRTFQVGVNPHGVSAAVSTSNGDGEATESFIFRGSGPLFHVGPLQRYNRSVRLSWK